jgi:RNA polymerase sigma factor (TIGR02999 family)
MREFVALVLKRYRIDRYTADELNAATSSMSEVTQILEQIQQGDRSAASELLPLVYAELRRLAVHRMTKEKPGLTLQPTALVHEAYLRLVGDAAIQWDGRAHFFAAAAEAMRRILIENARRRHSLKQGGAIVRRELADDDAVVNSGDPDELLDLDAALTKLAATEPELASLVELRFFAGLTVEEAALVLGISARTVKRNWAFARAWLGRELNPQSSATEQNSLPK